MKREGELVEVGFGLLVLTVANAVVDTIDQMGVFSVGENQMDRISAGDCRQPLSITTLVNSRVLMAPRFSTDWPA